MKIIRTLLLSILGLALLAPAHALAQISNATVVSACGTPPATYSAGANRAITQDTTGKICDTGGGGSGGGGGATSGAVVSFHQTTTASAVALGSHTYTNGIVIQALTANSLAICTGGTGVTTSTGYCLSPGQAISYGVANSNQVFIVGSNTSDIVQVTGN